MCGIAGFIGRGNKETLKKMTDAISHRGPDEEGFFIDGNVFLGHRRLAVIDLKTGSQPMINENGDVTIVFNGEIYNFKDLKDRLSAHKFKTASDTETLVHGYEEWGEKVFEHLNGMFSVAIWDAKNKKLVIGRDRFGEKPLYFAILPGAFVFGSELKSICEYPDFKKRINLLSLEKYFFYEYIPSPHTIFENVKKLGPGQALLVLSCHIE